MSLTAELKEELEKEYFLIGKRSALGGAVVLVIAIFGFSFSGAMTALKSVVAQEIIDRLHAADEVAARVLNADSELSRTLKYGEQFSFSNEFAYGNPVGDGWAHARHYAGNLRFDGKLTGQEATDAVFRLRKPATE